MYTVKAFLMIGLLFSLASCFTQNQKTLSSSVLKVNEHSLSVKEFSQKLAQLLKDLDALAAKDPNNVVRAKETLLSQFIIDCLIQDYATANQIEVSAEILDSEVNRYRALYPDDLSFRKMLAEEGLSLADWRKQLRARLLEKIVFERIGKSAPEITNAEIQSYFDSNKEQFKKRDRILMRQIVTDEESKMDVILKELKTKDFAGLAQKYSITPEAKSGGLVGWIEKGSVDYFDPLFQLREGVTSDMFKSPFGFHIARVEKKSPAHQSTLNEIKPQIVRTLRSQREQALFKSWLDEQIRGSHIFRNNELIRALNIDTKDKE